MEDRVASALPYLTHSIVGMYPQQTISSCVLHMRQLWKTSPNYAKFMGKMAFAARRNM